MACPYPGLGNHNHGQPQGIAPTGIDPHSISMDYFQYNQRYENNRPHLE
jgi:hypothetical protein